MKMRQKGSNMVKVKCTQNVSHEFTFSKKKKLFQQSCRIRKIGNTFEDGEKLFLVSSRHLIRKYTKNICTLEE